MPQFSAQSESATAASRGWLYTPFLISMLCHLVAIVICAFVMVVGNISAPVTEIDAAWDSSQTAIIDEAPKPQQRDAPLPESQTVRASVLIPNRTLSASTDLTPTKQPRAVSVADDNSALMAGLADDVGALSGNGSGSGGKGKTSLGSGFFGFKPEGNSIVFVVDASASMNRPHDSEWKTRFRRLKAELVNSVASMTTEQKFFIIFFNDETHLMPARSMQSASSGAKQSFLKWVATRRAIGSTDPRPALGFALRLRPDTIYFLTDGSFDGNINRDLTRLRQKHTAIHTFAFSDRTGEGVMKVIARSNGGKYHYIK